MDGRWEGWAGRLGLVLSLLLWVASIAALLAALRANEAAGLMAHGRPHMPGRVEHLRGLAVMWCVVLTGLQISAGVLGSGVLRAFYRLRTAVCFALSAGAVILLNMAWLLGVLVWLRAYGDTR